MLTLIHGSHRHGYSWDVTNALKKQLEFNNIEHYLIDVSSINLNYCCGNQVCQAGECIYQQDDFSLIKDKILNAQGIYIITPTYFNMPPAKLKCLIDRTNALLPIMDNKESETFFGAYVCGEADSQSVDCNMNLLIEYAFIMGWNNITRLNTTECITDSPKVDSEKILRITELILEELQAKGE